MYYIDTTLGSGWSVSDDAGSQSAYESATAVLRDSLKWMAAAAGAVAAALIAGLQLTTIGGSSTGWMIAAAVGAAAAIGLVLSFVVAATRVLTIQGPTVTELSNTELSAASQGVTSDDPDLRWIAQRRTLLLGTAETLSALYVDELVAAQEALRALRTGKSARLAGRDLNPAVPTDLAFADTYHSEAEAKLRKVEAALIHRRTRDQFDILMTRFRWWAFVFLAAVLIFAIATSYGQAPKTGPVTAPTPVTVYYTGTAHPCGSTRQGVAVSGTWDAPVVVLAPAGACPAERVIVTGSMVVLPHPAP